MDSLQGPSTTLNGLTSTRGNNVSSGISKQPKTSEIDMELNFLRNATDQLTHNATQLFEMLKPILPSEMEAKNDDRPSEPIPLSIIGRDIRLSREKIEMVCRAINIVKSKLVI